MSIEAELRAYFVVSASKRLEQMGQLVARLDENAGDAEAMHELTRHFHAMAGMGGTYGFPRISQLGDEGEATVDIDRWRMLIAEMRSELC